jgi:hypothetical protein
MVAGIRVETAGPSPGSASGGHLGAVETIKGVFMTGATANAPDPSLDSEFCLAYDS